MNILIFGFLSFCVIINVITNIWFFKFGYNIAIKKNKKPIEISDITFREDQELMDPIKPEGEFIKNDEF